MCFYRDGRDSVAWHGDTIGRSSTQDTMVAILSLGEARRLSLRPRAGGASISFPVGHGDLLVMGGSCQRTWEHAVLKTARPVGPAHQHPVPPARRALSAPAAGDTHHLPHGFARLPGSPGNRAPPQACTPGEAPDDLGRRPRRGGGRARGTSRGLGKRSY